MDFLFALLGPTYLLAVAWPLAHTDIREHRLPNRLVLPAFAVALVGQLLAAIIGGQWWRLAMAVLAAATALGVGLLANRFASLGMGDVKLIAAMSLALGWFSPISPLVALALAFAIASAVVLVLLILRRSRLDSSIALGPYLLLGFAASLASIGW